jgi:hypothetical protein
MTGRDLTTFRLAAINLLAKPWRTAGLAALVGVFAFALLAGSVIDRQLAKGLGGLSERLGADLLIVPYGYERSAKAALLRGEPGSFYMSAKVFERLRNFPGVAAATPQLFLASLATACCSERVQIIAYDQESDFLVKPWLEELGEADVVGIDDGELFERLAEWADQLANRGKIVEVSALVGDLEGRTFKGIMELMSVSERLQRLDAVCPITGLPAPFSVAQCGVAMPISRSGLLLSQGRQTIFVS